MTASPLNAEERMIAVARTREGLCSRCGVPAADHAGGNCPDGAGTYSWAFERPDMEALIANLQSALDYAKALDWWKDVRVAAPTAADILAWLEHYSRDLRPDVIASRAWGEESEKHRAWAELFADISMAFWYLETFLRHVHTTERCIEQKWVRENWAKEIAAGVECSCPRYPCKLSEMDPFEDAASDRRNGLHYVARANERMERLEW